MADYNTIYNRGWEDAMARVRLVIDAYQLKARPDNDFTHGVDDACDHILQSLEDGRGVGTQAGA